MSFFSRPLGVAGLALVVLAGCPEPEDTGDLPQDTGADGDNGGDDGSGNGGDDGGRETGIAQIFLTGTFTTADGAFTGGTYGISLMNYELLPDELDSRCSVIGAWREGPITLPPCEGCDWSFYLQVDDSVATGPDCDDFGLRDGFMDDSAGGFGWTDEYLYEYGGYTYTYSQMVWYYFDAPYNYWAVVGRNIDGYPGYNTGDATAGGFFVPLSTRYYYFYP